MTKTRFTVALVLIPIIATLGCFTAAQWFAVATADLPIVTQMAINIVYLSEGTPDPADLLQLQNVSKEVAADVALIEAAYTAYKQSPSATTLQKITSAIQAVETDLPNILTAAHIKNPQLNARVSAAVGLVLSTIQAFAQLVPQPAPVGGKVKAGKAAIHIPTPEELRLQWQQKVGQPLQ